MAGRVKRSSELYVIVPQYKPFLFAPGPFFRGPKSFWLPVCASCYMLNVVARSGPIRSQEFPGYLAHHTPHHLSLQGCSNRFVLLHAHVCDRRARSNRGWGTHP